MSAGLNGEMPAEQEEMPIPLAARIDDGDLPPEAIRRRRPVRAVEPPSAQAYLWTTPSESGYGDNWVGARATAGKEEGVEASTLIWQPDQQKKLRPFGDTGT